MGWTQIVSALLVTILILYLAYVFTRYAGKGMQVRGRGMAGRMKLIDRMALAPDKSVAIVQIGERYLVLGISSSQVNLLAEITKEEMELTEPEAADGPDSTFTVLLRQKLEKIKEKKG